jgi:hypothetical protein
MVILGDGGDGRARSCRRRTQVPTVVIIIVIDEDHGFPCEVYDVGHARMANGLSLFVVLWVGALLPRVLAKRNFPRRSSLLGLVLMDPGIKSGIRFTTSELCWCLQGFVGTLYVMISSSLRVYVIRRCLIIIISPPPTAYTASLIEMYLECSNNSNTPPPLGLTIDSTWDVFDPQ